MSIEPSTIHVLGFVLGHGTRYSEESVIINGYTVEEVAADTDISLEEVQKLAAGLALTIS